MWIFLPLVVLAQGGIASNPLALDSVVGVALVVPVILVGLVDVAQTQVAGRVAEITDAQ